MLDWGRKEEGDNLAWNTTVFLAIKKQKCPLTLSSYEKVFTFFKRNNYYHPKLFSRATFKPILVITTCRPTRLLCMKKYRTRYRTPQVTERGARKHASGQNPLKSTSWSLQLYSIVFIRSSLKSSLHNSKLLLYSLKGETLPSSLTPLSCSRNWNRKSLAPPCHLRVSGNSPTYGECRDLILMNMAHRRHVMKAGCQQAGMAGESLLAAD